MKIRIHRLLAALVPVLTLVLVTGPARADEAARYSEYLSQVGENRVLAGALDLNALRSSYEGSIRVIDLRTAAEGAAEEAIEAEGLGMEYANIPVSSAVVDAAQVAALRDTLNAAGPDELVVVHCRSGNRAGLLWGALQLEAGKPLEQVQEEVSGVVTAPRIVEGLAAYAKTLDAGL